MVTEGEEIEGEEKDELEISTPELRKRLARLRGEDGERAPIHSTAVSQLQQQPSVREVINQALIKDTMS